MSPCGSPYYHRRAVSAPALRGLSPHGATNARPQQYLRVKITCRALQLMRRRSPANSVQPDARCGAHPDLGLVASMSDSAPRRPALSPHGPRPSFLADAMLERLARWLRVLGYDVASATIAGPKAETLLAQAASQGRILLTRSRRLAEPGVGGDILFIQPSAPLAQLGQVIAQLELRGPWTLFTRCLVCNALLSPPAAALPDASGSIPSGTVSRECPRCGRHYWEGVHTRRMRAALKRGLGPRFAEVVG
jgi:uncharacterized protein